MTTMFDAPTLTERVRSAFARVRECDRPEVWIHLRPESDVVAEAARIAARVEAGAQLPLAGKLFAVKDNIDVAGLPTTAGCPEFGYTPQVSSPAVARLLDAGALVLGKTNLDQFATGLVGTRSPYGIVRAARYPDRVSGGSSSGSGVAVGLGLVDFALGTDTAGSGRVPAAFNGVVGIKPTLGLVPTSGVVPACADFDCVTVMAPTVDLAALAMSVMIGPDARDPRSRTWPSDVPLSAPRRPRVGVPLDAQLDVLSDGYRAGFATAARRAREAGADVVPVDIDSLLAAARLLYDGALVAERFDAVGDFVVANPDATLDPTVAAIVRGAAEPRAHEFVRDTGLLVAARHRAAALFSDVDALLLPTTTEHPLVEDVLADPVEINRRLGTFTNFCNLLDLSSVAVPVDGAPGESFGVMTVAPAFGDQVALDVAARIAGSAPAVLAPDAGVPLAVFGAHLRDQPLHHQLEALGARFERPVTTTDDYLMVRLDSVPPKPGLVRVAHGVGRSLPGELYRISPAGLGSFLAALPSPMALTEMTLADGTRAVGFTCTPAAAAHGVDITAFGGWRAYLAGASA
ncbi:allophanate hydrolase [Rhodococcus sp. SGAir0479]|uniref:allophanate hydrolase n=1 Tax=Rhodococcus sp. SGAir0479 TaxID=2567884 RepID=UPI0010CD354B|nr:allophanate hydrolase [Rhodococcus sp. SGAir0479]QCQ90397.1 allophanate hydrolase [Rhodococcus sp. SGAir0479]